MNIYISKSGTQTGPFGEEQLQGMLAEGVVAPDDLAWREGLPEWQPLHLLLGIHQPPPSPAAPPPMPAPAPVSRPSAQAAGPVGVGGWLVFFCVGLTIISPLLSLAQMMSGWEQTKPAFEVMPALKNVVLWENIGSTALLVYGIVVGCMIWGGSPRGRELARTFLLVRPVAFIGIELIALFMVSKIPDVNPRDAIAGVLPVLFQVILHTVIWTLYFKKSIRVRNTYGEESATLGPR